MVKHRSKKIHILISFVFLGLFIASACGGRQTPGDAPSAAQAADSPEKRGAEVIAQYLKRDAAPYRKMRVRFTIRAEGDPEKVYEVDSWRKQTPEATTTLTQIVKPVEDSDLGSLTLEQKGQKTAVVTYAASRGEFRETDTRKMFFGGLTAGELLGEWDKFAYRLAGEKEIGGLKVYEVEGTLKPDADSLIAGMRMFFRADNYVPVELHLLDSNAHEIRTYKTTDYKDDADRPYATKTEVENPIYNSTITIEILSREFPPVVDDALFSREKLRQLAKK